MLSQIPSAFISARLAVLVCASSYKGWEGEGQIIMESSQGEARWGAVWYRNGEACVEEVSVFV